MSIKEQIRAEIERQKEQISGLFTPGSDEYYAAQDEILDRILAFLDTLQEQSVEGMEEAAGAYLDNHKPLTRYNWGDLMDAFKAGAEWMKSKYEK